MVAGKLGQEAEDGLRELFRYKQDHPALELTVCEGFRDFPSELSVSRKRVRKVIREVK
jgi:hypothetical protein